MDLLQTADTEVTFGRTFSPRWPVGLILWIAVVLVWVVWAPFPARQDGAAISLNPPDDLFEVVGNLLLLAPLSVVLSLAGADPPIRGRFLRVVMAAGAISLLIETGQIWVANRIVSPIDVLFNVTGAAVASWATIRFVQTARQSAAAMLFSALAVFAAVLLGMGVPASGLMTLRLADWEATYPILLSDEVGGSRSFEGAVTGGFICAGSGRGVACALPGATPQDRAKLAAAAERSQRVVVQGTYVSEAENQWGPARIVTWSAGTDMRNVTLAQQGDGLVFRVRTLLTGRNGVEPEFVLPHAVRVGVLTTARGEFDRGRILLESCTEYSCEDATIRLGLLNAWTLTRQATLDQKTLAWGTMIGAMILVLPLGLASGAVARGVGRGIVVSVVVMTLVLVIGGLAVGLGSSLTQWIIALGVSIAGGVFGALDPPSSTGWARSRP